ncbi:zinc finger, CCHC-type containing protein [Tanacetum coccineum]
MHFLISSMSVVYMLTTLIFENGGDDATVEQIWKRAKWDNDDYVCRGLILIGMSDSLFDIYQNVESSKELWDSLKAKYMTEDASSKKFLVSCIIDKLPPSWKDFKHTFKYLKEELTLVESGSHLGIEESLRVQDSDKPKGNNVVSPSVVNMVKHNNFLVHIDNKMRNVAVVCGRGWIITNNRTTALVHGRSCVDLRFSSRKIVSLFNVLHVPNIRKLNIINNNIASAFMSTSKLNDSILWHARLGHVYFKRMQDMSKDGTESRVPGAVVRLPDPKLKTMGERGIECIFVGYAEHSKAFRFFVIEPNESVSINSIIESRDAMFDENRFSSIPRTSFRIPSRTEDIGGSLVPEEVTEEVAQQPEPELKKSKRNRTPKDFGLEFQLYLIEGTRDEVSDQHSYFFNFEDDPKTFDETMKSQDVAFWKEAINDEMDFIMGNNTWVLTDLPPGCRPLGCKWIFKRKLNVDETVEKFKTRLVIQGFKQNLIIHQMDVKTAFLNVELEDKFYMNQPLGFILPANENKVCKLIKSLYGLKRVPKQWHQKFDEVVLSNGYLLNQADKCVYSKFDASGKGVIICLYVDDMLIFGTDQVQVDLTKEFLSLRFSMKDMGEADVILGIRIKHKSNGIAISQSHYIEKILKKFNYSDCTLVSTPLDTCEKLMPNRGVVVSQLEYSRVIGCLMYAMTCTRPDIAFSNPGTQHWQAIQRVPKYLKKTMDYRLVYSGYPSVLEGYTDASWISNTEDNSSTSDWVFLLGGGAISWAPKKQTCITGSTMESEFVALAAAGKEVECVATLAKAYSQMYNEKSRHLGVRHSMILELITNEVVSIEFVRSQQNLADHLTKGLARDLVIKSAEGMGLKSS